MTEKSKSFLKLAFLFALAFSYVGYQHFFAAEPKPDGLVEVVLTSPTGEMISVKSEMATDDASRARGLMYRRDLAINEGMLFLWKEADKRSFWMKNTYIPLDMIFINGTNVVGVVQNAEPHTLTPRTVDAKANAVLEVNAGFAKMYNIDDKWKVSFAISDVTVN